MCRDVRSVGLVCPLIWDGRSLDQNAKQFSTAEINYRLYKCLFLRVEFMSSFPASPPIKSQIKDQSLTDDPRFTIKALQWFADGGRWMRGGRSSTKCRVRVNTIQHAGALRAGPRCCRSARLRADAWVQRGSSLLKQLGYTVGERTSPSVKSCGRRCWVTLFVKENPWNVNVALNQTIDILISDFLKGWWIGKAVCC